MKESSLLEYFYGEISATKLHNWILSSISQKIRLTTLNFDEDLRSEYILTKNDIEKICDDFLKSILNEIDIYFLGFIMFGSTEINAPDDIVGQRILKIINDWANYAINFPITKENMKKWKHYLNTGEDLLE